jgi:archaellum component FlaC
MSEERFDRIEQRLDRAGERFDQIDEWQRRADERFDRVDERFDRIDERFDRVDERFDRIDERFDRVDERFGRMDERFDRIDQRIGVLHEDVLGRIAATGEDAPATKREMAQGFADLRELIERRLDPLEAAVRDHSQRITALEKRRP